MFNKKVIFIVGPTATGKTRLAVKLAKKIGGEIISADSMQAYKGMEIVSQAPTKKERSTVQHHLVSFLDPSREYSAGIFAEKAGKSIKNIIKKGKTPIIAGGSGLYIKALIDGIFPSGGKDEKLRKRLEKLARREGRHVLHEKLKKIDPGSAEKIHPNDLKRIIRAIEICKTEKKPKTSLKKLTRGISGDYDVRIFGIDIPREKLYSRINRRVEMMFKKGLLKEAKKLLAKKLSITSQQALGLNELKDYFEGKCTIEGAKELIKRHTRRYAKRQLTWFRADKRIVWINRDVPM